MIPKVVEKIENRKIVSDMLSLDRVWGSEALMSLNDKYWRLASWYGYQDYSNLALALMFKNITPAPLFLIGEPSGLAYIIRQEVNAESIFVECPLSCVGVLKLLYNFDQASIMNKMQLEHFRPSTIEKNSKVRKLTKADMPKARELFQRNTELATFDIDQFEHGVYYGVEEDGNIVSMAGTTVLCMDYRTATIGNVLTDNEYRHQGYASYALVQVCQELLEKSFDCICIKVNRGNSHAINIYRRIGFTKKTEYFEGLGKKK